MKREHHAPCLTEKNTGMAFSILAEIGQLLMTLADNGQPGAIDLRSLPMTDADREQLEELLGHGEVNVTMDLAGASETWETSYAGVWWIRHRGARDMIASDVIAVTRIPEILITHPADIKAAARRIKLDLSPRSPEETNGKNERETSNA